MALTGGLAGGGKMTLLAYQIWKDEINAKGGLLGRPVELVYYDDQSRPSMVPNLYAKLLDVDKVDLVISPYATNQIAPAMPIVMQKGMVLPTCSPLLMYRGKEKPRLLRVLRRVLRLGSARLLRHQVMAGLSCESYLRTIQLQSAKVTLNIWV
jgi:hypothetical protein